MPKIDLDTYVEHESEIRPAKQKQRRAGRPTYTPGREERLQALTDLMTHADKLPAEVQASFSPSFRPAEHERFWLMNNLEGFYINQVITDILWKAKGGKEANVYCCTAHPSTGLELIAAKVYRPRMFRNLRNDARYRQGREIVNEDGRVVHSREMVAVRKNTRFGQELRHMSWLETEYQTLQLLYGAGADVPQPITRSGNAILMEYVGAERAPAPCLNEISLTRAEARSMFSRLVENLEIMLASHRVHADLSAYNILYWEGKFTIIDFPQAVDPRRNPDAADLFQRDVERVCQYFARFGIRRDPRALAHDLWNRHLLTNAMDGSALGARDMEELAEEA